MGADSCDPEIHVVHGLNLDGQADAADGGTNVTVCAGDSTLVADLEFGQVAGPLPVATGESPSVQVYDSGGVSCASPGGASVVIDQSIDSVPTGAVSLVATQGPENDSPTLITAVPDVSCIPPPFSRTYVYGRVSIVHAADAGTLDISYDQGYDDPSENQPWLRAETLSFGERTDAELLYGPYNSLIFELDGMEFFVFENVSFGTYRNDIYYLVGNQSGAEGNTPVVAIPHTIEVQECRPASTTTSTSAPPSNTAQPSAAALPVAARPAYTG